MKLSIIVPVYNSEKTISILVEETVRSLDKKINFEIILVNDCSKDNSWKAMKDVQVLYAPLVTIINLKENTGENNAVMAGFNFARGAYLVHMDDDLQNPPLEILKLLSEIEKGYDVVYSYYSQKKHSHIRNIGSRLHNMIAYLCLKKPKNLYLSTFRIITRNLKNEICKYKGAYTYIDALVLLATTRIGTVQVNHSERAESRSNYTYLKLMQITLNMIFSHYTFLLKFFLLITVALISSITFLLYTSLLMKTRTFVIHFLIFSILFFFILTILAIIWEYRKRSVLHEGMRKQYEIKEIIKSS